MFKGRNRSIKA